MRPARSAAVHGCCRFGPSGRSSNPASTVTSSAPVGVRLTETKFHNPTAYPKLPAYVATIWLSLGTRAFSDTSRDGCGRRKKPAPDLRMLAFLAVIGQTVAADEFP